MVVFLFTMAMVLQLTILHKEPKYPGFTIFRDYIFQQLENTIKGHFCSFYQAPYKSILFGVANDTIA